MHKPIDYPATIEDCLSALSEETCEVVEVQKKEAPKRDLRGEPIQLDFH